LEQCRLECSNDAVLPPFAKYPLTSTANLSTNFTLTYTSVPNASAYEVQVAALSDADFKNPIFQTSSSSTSVLTKMNYYANQLKWRVRSVVGTTKSAWSEVQYVVSNPNNYISTNYLTENSALKVLEYSGNYINNQSIIKLTIASDSSFKKILCTKMLKILQPNQLIPIHFGWTHYRAIRPIL
jgi:hypothetical protein